MQHDKLLYVMQWAITNSFAKSSVKLRQQNVRNEKQITSGARAILLVSVT